MTVNSVKESFKNDAGKEPDDIQKNEGDYVANPQNILNPTTWSKPGHGTDNYGASKLEKEESKL